VADNLKIVGLEEFERLLSRLPDKVVARAGKRGLTKAASRLRTRIRQAAPKRSGRLRQAIQVGSSRRHPIKWVGLRPIKGRAKKDISQDKYKTPYYYRVLERDPRHAFFARAVKQSTPEIMRILKEETKKALANEAGKMAAKLSRRR